MEIVGNAICEKVNKRRKESEVDNMRGSWFAPNLGYARLRWRRKTYVFIAR